MLSYEELHANTTQKAKELAKFLGTEVDDSMVQSIVNKCSFASMRDRKGKEWIETYGEPVMYRKGKVRQLRQTHTHRDTVWTKFYFEQWKFEGKK